MPTISTIPRHIAIIMDGNNRWAKQRHLPNTAGHREGVETVRKVLQGCADHGVKVLTLFAFSSENWQRPSREVNTLMSLFSSYLRREANNLHEKGVRIRFIGERSRFSARLLRQMEETEQLTAGNTTTTLVIAVDYGGQWDIVQAAARLAQDSVRGDVDPGRIDIDTFERYISIGDLPKPDLCIRTGGEHRISNFLLWQLAYTELYFTDIYWPDFDAAELAKAIADYGSRQRRFGKTGDQLERENLRA